MYVIPGFTDPSVGARGADHICLALWFQGHPSGPGQTFHIHRPAVLQLKKLVVSSFAFFLNTLIPGLRLQDSNTQGLVCDFGIDSFKKLNDSDNQLGF